MNNLNLSDRIAKCSLDDCYDKPVLRFVDVKEFIRLLKDELRHKIHYTFMPDIIMTIDKLAGEKLK